MAKSQKEIIQKIREGQKRQQQEKIAKADPWYHKFQNEHCVRLELDPSRYKNPNGVPFGYTSWQVLCEDIDKWCAETMNTYKNVCIPGSVKKPVFYKFGEKIEKEDRDEVMATLIRIHNAGSPQTMVIEFAATATPEAVDEVTNLLKLGTNRKLQYLYTQNRENKKVKLRLAKNPTLDMLKIRILWLFRDGYGVSFRE